MWKENLISVHEIVSETRKMANVFWYKGLIE
ncbi:Uncharacterised protein [Shewanella putrefaciens]|nr:Uncharacterised protein [Shewanella putrefaciens]